MRGHAKWMAWLTMFLAAGAAMIACDELYFAFARGAPPILWQRPESKFVAFLAIGGAGLIAGSLSWPLRIAGTGIVARYVLAILVITRVVNAQVVSAQNAFTTMLVCDVVTLVGFVWALIALMQRESNVDGNDQTNSERM
jgi:hypothetical protein